MGFIIFPSMNIMYFDHIYSLYYFWPLLFLLRPSSSQLQTTI